MSRTVTLLSMREQVRDLGGFDNSRVVTDAKLTASVNMGIAETWRLLTLARPDDYIQSAAGAIIANNDTVALPATFLRLMKVELQDGSDYHKLHAVDLGEQHRFRTSNQWSMYYRRQGTNLKIVPIPTAAWTLRIWYIAAAPILAADGDTFDGIDGYEDLVVAIAIYKRQLRENVPDLERWLREVERLKADIKPDADNDDEGEPYYLSGTGPSDGLSDEDW